MLETRLLAAASAEASSKVRKCDTASYEHEIRRTDDAPVPPRWRRRCNLHPDTRKRPSIKSIIIDYVGIIGQRVAIQTHGLRSAFLQIGVEVLQHDTQHAQRAARDAAQRVFIAFDADQCPKAYPPECPSYRGDRQRAGQSLDGRSSIGKARLIPLFVQRHSISSAFTIVTRSASPSHPGVGRTEDHVTVALESRLRASGVAGNPARQRPEYGRFYRGSVPSCCWNSTVCRRGRWSSRRFYGRY